MKKRNRDGSPKANSSALPCRRSEARHKVCLTLLIVLAGVLGRTVARAQETSWEVQASSSGSATVSCVPRLIRFRGEVTDASGRAQTGGATLIFSIYEFQTGGTPLWIETQKVQLDRQGHYTVLLGASSPEGLPMDLFASGRALWLGVQPQLSGVGEQPRVMLVAVPYALRAADADTLGRKPASAFVMAEQSSQASSSTTGSAANLAQGSGGPAKGPVQSASARPVAPMATLGGTGTANTIAKFIDSSDVGNSALTEKNGFLGLNVLNPSAPFELLPAAQTGTGNGFGVLGFVYYNPGAAATGNLNGSYVEADVQSGNAQNVASLTGMTAQGLHYGTGTVTYLAGADGDVKNFATGTVNSTNGFAAHVINAGAGTIKNGYGIYVYPPQNLGGGTFNNFYGVYIINPTKATTNYGLYSAGGTNYFGGNVGIGTLTPSVPLDVNGTANFRSRVAFRQPVTFPASGQTFPGVDSVAGADGSPVNPTQVALLRWYQGNKAPVTLALGGPSVGVAFDGSALWVTNGSTVTKLQTNDGSALGTFTVGSGAYGVAFDGADMWVANSGSNSVSKLRASDGVTLGTFAVGNSPRGVAFDGANIWVANYSDGTVTKLRASDGGTLGTFTTGLGPEGLCFDGANIWVTNNKGGNVTKLRAIDGSNLGTFSVGAAPEGVAFDGVSVWVSNFGGGTATRLRASDGSNLGTFSVGNAPWGVAFDGANIWVANSGGNSVTKLRASDGANLGTFGVGTSPEGVAFDGSNIWVANNVSNTASKL